MEMMAVRQKEGRSSSREAGGEEKKKQKIRHSMPQIIRECMCVCDVRDLN